MEGPLTAGEGSASTSSTANHSLAAPYLSVPSKEPEPPADPSTPPLPLVRKDRIYIGNLHPSLDEYALLQIFQKYGRVAQLDFLFHRAGPLKGKPRGYAFLEYVDKEDASKALVELNDKVIRGRRLVVTFSNQAPIDPTTYTTKRAPLESSRPTALSLLKSSRSRKPEDLIRKMEAKLDQMNKDKHPHPQPGSISPDGLPERPSEAVICRAKMDLEETEQTTTTSGGSRTKGASSSPAVSVSSRPASPKKTPTPTVRDLASTSSSPASTPPLHKVKSLAGARTLSGVRIVKNRGQPLVKQ